MSIEANYPPITKANIEEGNGRPLLIFVQNIYDTSYTYTLNLSIDGRQIFPDYTYAPYYEQNPSEFFFLNITPGTHTLTTFNSTVSASATYDFRKYGVYYAVASGSIAEPYPIILNIYGSKVFSKSETKSSFTFIQGTPDAGTVNVLLNGNTIFPNVAYTQSVTTDIDVNFYTIVVDTTASPPKTLINVGTYLTTNTSFVFVLSGSAPKNKWRLFQLNNDLINPCELKSNTDSD